MKSILRKIGSGIVYLLDKLWKGLFVYILLIITQAIIGGIFDLDDAIGSGWGRGVLWIVLGVVGEHIWSKLSEKITHGAGLSAANAEAARQKRNRKARILAVITHRSTITNDEVEHMLSVSDATATNYLSELESEGLISQIGSTGHSVRYRRNG